MFRKIITFLLVILLCAAPLCAAHAANKSGISTPDVPQSLSATQLGDGSIYLLWTASPGVSYYEIAWTTDESESYSLLGTSSASHYIVPLPVSSGAVFFRVRACTAGGSVLYSDYSGAVKIDTSLTIGVPARFASSLSDSGVLLSWRSDNSVDGYELDRELYGSENFIHIYAGASPSFTDASVTVGGLYRYRVRSYTKDRGTVRYSGYQYCYAHIVPVDSLSASPDSVVMNAGKTYQIPFQVSPSDYNYGTLRWTSSDSRIASVSPSGSVTAISLGTAKITAVSLNGVSLSFTVTVNASKKGTIRLNHLTGPFDQLKGKTNRIDGTISSDYPIRKVMAKVINAAGKTEKTYTVKLTGNKKTYDLGKIYQMFPFSKLQAGSKKFRLYAYNTKGGGLLCTKTFDVLASPPSASHDKIEKAIEWGMSRMGDPYSQIYRGTLYYTDCSYFVKWCYNQVGISLAGNSRTQSAALKKAGRLIKRSELRRGDLVFYTSDGSTSTVKCNHVALYLGDDLVLESVGRGVSISHMGNPTIFARPCS